MAKFNRRDFLNISAVAVASLGVSTSMTGCELINTSKLSKVAIDSDLFAFNHGVASGDPLADRVIIWSRITPLNEVTGEVLVHFQISKSKKFDVILRSGSVKTSAAQDFTVKVDIQELDAESEYFYRFFIGEAFSVIGKMKTLRVGDIEEVRFAVLCCANYPAGYFNVYSEVAKLSNLDVVVHTGDYIYEYGMFDDAGAPGYATENAKDIGRVLPQGNDEELLTLDQYRNRYALYKTEPELQALHQNIAFICVWDDHELADNSYKDGAHNHNEYSDFDEGNFQIRKNAATQAYFEWLPIRPVIEGDNSVIYRSFDFGELVSLHMLDTRLVGRDEQNIISDYLVANDNQGLGYDRDKMIDDMYDPARSLLGQTQFDWLEKSLSESSALWQVLGQQVLMGKMSVPNELLLQFGTVDASGSFVKNILELSAIKARVLLNDPTLSEEEIRRTETGIAYNLDAWDGYAYEREKLYAVLKKLNKNVVVYAGDSHNAWSNNLVDDQGDAIGVEFATASISSPGMEKYLMTPEFWDLRLIEEAFELLFKDLAYCNLNNRGFMLSTYTKEKVSNEWIYVDTIKSRDYSTKLSRKKNLISYVGENKLASAAEVLLKETLPNAKDALFNSLF